MREASLEIQALRGEIHLPYWLGFYGASDALRCRVMDAVRRRMEGAKAYRFFEQGLAGPTFFQETSGADEIIEADMVRRSPAVRLAGGVFLPARKHARGP